MNATEIDMPLINLHVVDNKSMVNSGDFVVGLCVRQCEIAIAVGLHIADHVIVLVVADDGFDNWIGHRGAGYDFCLPERFHLAGR